MYQLDTPGLIQFFTLEFREGCIFGVNRRPAHQVRKHFDIPINLDGFPRSRALLNQLLRIHIECNQPLKDGKFIQPYRSFSKLPSMINLASLNPHLKTSRTALIAAIFWAPIGVSLLAPPKYTLNRSETCCILAPLIVAAGFTNSRCRSVL